MSLLIRLATLRRGGGGGLPCLPTQPRPRPRPSERAISRQFSGTLKIMPPARGRPYRGLESVSHPDGRWEGRRGQFLHGWQVAIIEHKGDFPQFCLLQ